MISCFCFHKQPHTSLSGRGTANIHLGGGSMSKGACLVQMGGRGSTHVELGNRENHPRVFFGRKLFFGGSSSSRSTAPRKWRKAPQQLTSSLSSHSAPSSLTFYIASLPHRSFPLAQASPESWWNGHQPAAICRAAGPRRGGRVQHTPTSSLGGHRGVRPQGKEPRTFHRQYLATPVFAGPIWVSTDRIQPISRFGNLRFKYTSTSHQGHRHHRWQRVREFWCHFCRVVSRTLHEAAQHGAAKSSSCSSGGSMDTSTENLFDVVLEGCKKLEGVKSALGLWSLSSGLRESSLGWSRAIRMAIFHFTTMPDSNGLLHPVLPHSLTMKLTKNAMALQGGWKRAPEQLQVALHFQTAGLPGPMIARFYGRCRKRRDGQQAAWQALKSKYASRCVVVRDIGRTKWLSDKTRANI